ncbi:hypothetical protein EAH87_14555 [Sphingomonas koreensis]|nr:hypothetical protein EAH87_14555 [Sphingomonas koreensis]
MTMDAVTDLPADLPRHAAAPLEAVPAETIVEWPVGTFVENLAVLANGAIAISVHTDNAVEWYLPGNRKMRTPLPVPPAGLVARRGGGFYVAGGVPGEAPGRVWRVETDGSAALAADLADALFLNGMTPLEDGALLAADSILGCLWRIDPRTGAHERWFADRRLGKVTSFPLMPGANGLKIHSGYVYVTNTDRAELLRIPIAGDGTAGALEVVAEGLRGDDLAFDAEGAAYVATHIHNGVLRLSPDGTRRDVAGPLQGMPGSTAVAFGRGDGDRSDVYVTTTGGLIGPYEGVARTAKLVRLSVGVAGAPIPLID